jgi:hypothetical protein
MSSGIPPGSLVGARSPVGALMTEAEADQVGSPISSSNRSA